MTEYPDNFNDVPDSITTMRAMREDDPSAWTPRDVLIYVLKQIDAGEDVGKNLVVIYEKKENNEEDYTTFVARSAKNSRSTIQLGMIDEAKHMILTEDDED